MPIFTDEVIQNLFGKEDAENEAPGRLKDYFFKNKAFDSLVSNLPIRVLVGHKGVGKSALLKIAYTEDKENNVLCLWLKPDDVRRAVPAASGKDLNSRIDTWKRALTQLIAQEIATQHGNQALESIFSGETQSRMKDVVSIVKEIFSKKVDEGVSRIKNSVLDLFQKNNIIRVYLDDLDRGWEARREDIQNISALLNAVRDMCGYENNLQFRLGLRSDVYYLVRTSDESTDKIESNIIFLNWDNHQILVVAAKRIEAFFGRSVDGRDLLKRTQVEIGKYLHSVVEPEFSGSGKWSRVPVHRVLLSLVRQRPRDLVKLLSGAAKEAYRNDRERIATYDLQKTFEAYSNERLQDLVNEFKSELPQVSNLLRGMRPVKRERRTKDQFCYTNDQLAKKLKNLIDQNRFSFSNKVAVNHHSLANFLYKIDFIMARKELEIGILRKYFDQNRYLQDQFVDYGFEWEVHPAYRWALQPAAFNEIYDLTELERDE